jgi:iron complex transport system substrate-binding protein
MLCFHLSSCTGEKPEQAVIASLQNLDSLDVRYAQLFSIHYQKDYKILTIKKSHQNASQPEVYYLYEGDTAPKSLPAGAVAIQIPLKSLAVTSTSHLPHLELVGEGEVLKGFPGLDLISSPYFREKIDKGFIRDIGHENGLNKEELIQLMPEMVMGYTLGNNLDSYYDLRRLGIPVLLNAEYLEENPLGRAEWIKVTAAFFNKEKIADSVFTAIEQRYLELKNKASNASHQPSIISGIMYGDTWFAPGGSSWVARFFSDAGGNYLWKDQGESGSLELSFEAMLEKGQDADYWIGIADFKSKSVLAASQSRYQYFKAFENGALYSYTKLEGEKGGNGYLELGYARPDLVLADIIHMLHPDLLPNYETVFFEKLKP